MRNTNITIIVIALCLGIAGYVAWNMTKNGLIEPNPKPVSATAAGATKNVHVAPAIGIAPISVDNSSAGGLLDAFSKRKPEEVAQVNRKPLTREESNKRAKDNVDGRIRERRKELDSPDVIYAELYAKLKLPPAKLSLLKDLLVEYQFAGLIVNLGLRDSEEYIKTGMPPKEESEKRTVALREEIKTNLKNLLGDDACSYTMHYYDTLYQREEVNSINSYFKGKAELLTQEQTDVLIEILYNRVTVYDQSDIKGNDFYSKAKFTKQYTVENASGILTPSQISALNSFYNKKVQWTIDNTSSGAGKKLE